MGLRTWLGELARWRLGGRFGNGTRPWAPGSTLLAHQEPPIFAHWQRTHVEPLLEELGAPDRDTLFGHYLRDSAARTGAAVPRFLSLGAGNGATELRLAAALVADGLRDFTIECVEPDPLLQSNARATALARGLDRHIVPVRCDGNAWRARGRYDGVLANGLLDSTARLERLLDEVARSLADGAWFVVAVRIGRNGHRRWPEALVEVQRWFRELPASHRWNHQLRRHEQVFQDWDHSRIGEHGIRAEHVLPELLQRFAVPLFAGYGNLVDAFVGPAFGPNFAPADPWSRRFVANVHARDEELLQAGTLLPTHMVAVLSRHDEPVRCHARGLSPARCVRRA